MHRIFCCVVTILLTVGAVQAQIVTDGTLAAGSKVRLPGPDFKVTEDLGSRRGTNLFHSFEHFSIPVGSSVEFTGSPDVRTVISRVTGGSASHINGTITNSIAGANTILVNPSGIVFGAGASLNVSGSFTATTADTVTFSDGAAWPATPHTGSTLTSAKPASFGFLTGTGGISAFQANLRLSERRRSLRLLSPRIAIRDSRLTASEGAIDIANPIRGVAHLSVDGSPRILRASAGDSPALAGEHLVISGSRVTAAVAPRPPRGVSETDRVAVGGISLGASADIEIEDTVLQGGPLIQLAAAGDVTIRGSRIESRFNGRFLTRDSGMLLHGRRVAAERSLLLCEYDRENGGLGTFLEAPESLKLVDSRLSVDGDSNFGGGDAPLRITAGSVRVQNTQIDYSSRGESGKGFSIRSDGSVELLGSTHIVFSDAELDPLRIHGSSIVLDDVRFDDGADRYAAGGLQLRSRGGLRIRNSTLRAGAGLLAHADGALDVTDGTRLEANVRMALHSRKTLSIAHATLFTENFNDGGSFNGEIVLSGVEGLIAQSVSVESFTGGLGGAGGIRLRTNERATLRFVRLATEGEGDASNIQIVAPRGLAIYRSAVLANGASDGFTAAGQVRLLTGGNLVLKGSTVDANSNGAGGDIGLGSPQRLEISYSRVSANAGGDGDAILLNPAVLVMRRSLISGIAGGNPVEVQINPEAIFFLSTDSQILADNPLLPPDINVAGILLDLRTQTNSSVIGMVPDCAAMLLYRATWSSFVVRGREGTISEGWGVRSSKRVESQISAP